jgi:hypothetical protein
MSQPHTEPLATARPAILFRQHFPPRHVWITAEDLKARRFDKVELTADAY